MRYNQKTMITLKSLTAGFDDLADERSIIQNAPMNQHEPMVYYDRRTQSWLMRSEKMFLREFRRKFG
jgi:hypothetical protein